MKHVAMLLVSAALLASCKKDDHAVTLRAECERCTVDANGEVFELWGSREIEISLAADEAASITACRHVPDTTINGVDTTINTYSGAISVYIYEGHEHLAIASDAAFYPDDCATETAKVSD